MYNISEELDNLYEKYKNFNFNEHSNNIKEHYSKKEYSKGGELTNYGIYQQEFFNIMRISNLRIGKKVKKKPLTGIYFIYYFDDKDELIMSEKINGKFVSRQFFFKSCNEKDIVGFEYEGDIITTWYGKVFYNEDNQIIRYFDTEPSIYNIIIKEKLFFYERDIIKVTYNEYTRQIKNKKIYEIYTENWFIDNNKLNFINRKCMYID